MLKNPDESSIYPLCCLTTNILNGYTLSPIVLGHTHTHSLSHTHTHTHRHTHIHTHTHTPPPTHTHTPTHFLPVSPQQKGSGRLRDDNTLAQKPSRGEI